MSFQCLLIDDEPLARRILREYLDELQDFTIVEEFGGAVPAFDYLQNNSVDVIFLDINMPRINGVDFLRSLRNPPLVVFTTAYQEYAVEAFELEAFDYLVKPISIERFIQTIGKLKKRLTEASPEMSTPQISIKEGKRIYKLNLNDIQLLQAYGDYVRIYTKQKNYLTKDRLTNIHKSLTANFLQVHRSYIINLEKLSYLEGNHVMVGEEKVPVSGSYRDDLLARL